MEISCINASAHEVSDISVQRNPFMLLESVFQAASDTVLELGEYML